MLTLPAKREGDNTSGMAPPATALISQHPAATKMFSAAALATSPSGKKDGYASSRSSIHLLASILRKSSKASAETECDSTPAPQSKTIVTQPTVKIPTATTDTGLPPEQLASRPGTVANHANPRPAGKTERAGLSLSTVLTPPDLPADEGRTVPTKPAIAESSAHAGTDDDTHSLRNSMQATAFKKTKTMSQNAKRAIEDEPAVDTDAPVIEPTKSNPANAGASTGSTNNPVRGLAGQPILPLPAATASGATLDRSPTTSGQTSQSQKLIDASMGLDQGQNARLLRLSMNDEGWQTRLVRGLLDANNGQAEQKITVLLEPRKLGRMTLQVNVNGNGTAVQLTTATAEAAALFADAEQKLQQLFDQNGLKLTSLNTSTHQGGHQGMPQHQSRPGSGTVSGTAAKDTEDDENPSTRNSENGNNSQVNILA
jgi:flagellar hook-length control protein FliK